MTDISLDEQIDWIREWTASPGTATGGMSDTWYAVAESLERLKALDAQREELTAAWDEWLGLPDGFPTDRVIDAAGELFTREVGGS